MERAVRDSEMLLNTELFLCRTRQKPALWFFHESQVRLVSMTALLVATSGWSAAGSRRTSTVHSGSLEKPMDGIPLELTF
jgi:hypothetical protein